MIIFGHSSHKHFGLLQSAAIKACFPTRRNVRRVEQHLNVGLAEEEAAAAAVQSRAGESDPAPKTTGQETDPGLYEIFVVLSQF